MRRIALLLIALFLPAYGQAQGLTHVFMCNSCTETQFRDKAIESLVETQVQPYGIAYVGDRISGYLRAYRVNLISNPPQSLPYGVHGFEPTEAQQDEFLAYSDAYGEQGSAGTITVEIDAAPAALFSALSEVPPHFPGSSWDVRQDGAARNALFEWLSNTGNWPNQNTARLFYAKLVIQSGVSLVTGSDFTIRIEANHPDGSKTIAQYDSSCQCLAFVETRDSAGNLTSTASEQPVPVDYSSYEQPDAHLRLDYERGVEWLRSHGAASVGSPVRIYTPTVLVGDVVQVQE